MVSLSKLMEITEEGVTFVSPHTDEKMLLSPEESIHIQNALGADIMMQLDDVVHSLTTGLVFCVIFAEFPLVFVHRTQSELRCFAGPRVEEAMHRTLRGEIARKRPDLQPIAFVVH